MFRYKRFVGPVSYAAFDRSTQSSKVVVLASERGILAAVNSRTGALGQLSLCCVQASVSNISCNSSLQNGGTPLSKERAE